MAWENGLEGSVGLSSVFGLDGVDWSNWLDDDAAINALVNDFSNANDRDVSMDHGPGGASQGNVQGRQARGPTGQVEQSGDSVMEDYER
ncbi:hypothetical protein SLS58_010629 [Diplodia intermedia]|uniref:Uncharacterized protein n=1 Tax=Diplodia intermedia TaxID=856260 RepID=A0ABR3T4G4_9PEZI